MTAQQVQDEALPVEILAETGTYEGGWQQASLTETDSDGSDADAKAILDFARLAWDEAYTHVQGCRRRLTITTYGPNHPDGYAIRMQTRP